MAITAEKVRDLREKTGAGMMDCKRALEQTGGDEGAAIKILREKGQATAAKREGKVAGEGRCEAYIHMGGKIGVLVELNCETDFVARNEQFAELAREIAMQIAAANPIYIDRAEVPAEVVEREMEIYRQKARNEGKPEAALEKIVNGMIEKYYETNCLLEQPYIRANKQTIQELITETVGKLGEKIVVRRFSRFRVGEGA
jgi:elongation factor Ts